MKKKYFVLLVIIVIIGWNISLNEEKISFTNLALNNIEALAKQETKEKIFKYYHWYQDFCYVLVGGAYAKGHKVTCTDGNEHPECVSCVL